MHSRIDIRPGGEADSPLLVELFDEAVAWMLARGHTGQWGARHQKGTHLSRSTKVLMSIGLQC